MMSIIRSELTKIRTLPSVWIVSGILLALSVFFQFQGLASVREALSTLDDDGMHWWYDRPVPADLDIIASIGSSVFNPGIFFPLLGAVIAGAEFRTGQLGLSVLAVPSRVRLVVAKSCAVGLYALGFGLLFAALTMAFTYVAVRDWQPGLIWRPEALGSVTGSVLFVVAITLISFAVTLLTRRVLFGVLLMGAFVALTMTQALAALAPALDALTPFSAARNLLLQSDGLDLGGPPFTSTPAVGGVVLVVWVVLTTLCALVAVQRRDAR